MGLFRRLRKWWRRRRKQITFKKDVVRESLPATTIEMVDVPVWIAPGWDRIRQLAEEEEKKNER